MCASWSGASRWHNLTHFRWECEQCGARKEVAVVPYHGDKVYLCLVCFEDGWWKESRKHAHSHAEKGKP